MGCDLRRFLLVQSRRETFRATVAQFENVRSSKKKNYTTLLHDIRVTKSYGSYVSTGAPQCQPHQLPLDERSGELVDGCQMHLHQNRLLHELRFTAARPSPETSTSNLLQAPPSPEVNDLTTTTACAKMSTPPDGLFMYRAYAILETMGRSWEVHLQSQPRVPQVSCSANQSSRCPLCPPWLHLNQSKGAVVFFAIFFA